LKIPNLEDVIKQQTGEAERLLLTHLVQA